MARPLRDSPARSADPPPDAAAVEHAYRLQRARRRARNERARARRNARIRFWFVLTLMVALSVYFGVTVLRKLQEVFGL